MLPSNSVNYEGIETKSKDKGGFFSPIETIERSKDDIVIYPINKQRVNNTLNFSASLNNTNEKFMDTRASKDNKNYYKRNMSNYSQKQLAPGEADDSLNGKVDKLIDDIKRDTSQSQKRKGRPPNNDAESALLKHKLNSTVETYSSKVEDYFSRVVGGVKKNTNVIKGISDKIMRLQPKKRFIPDTSSTNRKTPEEKPKNIYTTINNRINEGSLNYLCFGGIKSSQKKFKSVLKEKVNNSFFQGEHDFYFGKITKLPLETLNTPTNNLNSLSNLNNLNNITSFNNSTEYNSLKPATSLTSLNSSSKRTKKSGYPHEIKEGIGLKKKNDFFDFNYQSKFLPNIKKNRI